MICCRNRSPAYRPPWVFFGVTFSPVSALLPPERLSPLQVASCASLQLLGVMNENAGVRLSSARSASRFFASGTTCLAQSPLSSSEWNQGNGLCLATYASSGVLLGEARLPVPAYGPSEPPGSTAAGPGAAPSGLPQVAGSRLGSLPRSCM